MPNPSACSTGSKDNTDPMYFAVDHDFGNEVLGWVTPDNPSKVPHIVVQYDGSPVRELEATVVRPDLREAGLHSTGLCGFLVDENNSPGLSSQASLELYHKEDGILLYRRPPSTSLPDCKLFRFDPQLIAAGALNSALGAYFQLPYSRLELLSEETVSWITRLPFCNSLYLTGAVRVRRIEPLLRNQGFLLTALLRDPVLELSERLLLLRAICDKPDMMEKFRLSQRVRGIVHAMAKDPWADDGIDRFLGSLHDEGRSALANPLAKLLGSRSAEHDGDDDLVSAALRTLSELDAVGIRSDMTGFTRSLAALLNAETFPTLEMPEYRSVLQLAEVLSDLKIVENLLGDDLYVYRTVEETYAQVYSS